MLKDKKHTGQITIKINMGGYLYILNILPDTVEEEMTSSYFVKAFWMQYYNRKLSYHQFKLTRQLSY